MRITHLQQAGETAARPVAASLEPTELHTGYALLSDALSRAKQVFWILNHEFEYVFHPFEQILRQEQYDRQIRDVHDNEVEPLRCALSGIAHIVQQQEDTQLPRITITSLPDTFAAIYSALRRPIAQGDALEVTSETTVNNSEDLRGILGAESRTDNNSHIIVIE